MIIFKSVSIKTPSEHKNLIGVYVLYNYLFRLQRSLQYFTLSQFFSHFLRQVKSFWQVKQVFSGKFAFLTPFISIFILNNSYPDIH
jgi:hypothetical protein